MASCFVIFESDDYRWWPVLIALNTNDKPKSDLGSLTKFMNLIHGYTGHRTRNFTSVRDSSLTDVLNKSDDFFVGGVPMICSNTGYMYMCVRSGSDRTFLDRLPPRVYHDDESLRRAAEVLGPKSQTIIGSGNLTKLETSLHDRIRSRNLVSDSRTTYESTETHTQNRMSRFLSRIFICSSLHGMSGFVQCHLSTSPAEQHGKNCS